MTSLRKRRRQSVSPDGQTYQRAVQKYAALKGERREYFDATLPGFGLRVAGPTDRNPEGRKSWVLFYRFRGDQKRLTLSRRYPALSLAAARKEAGDAFALIDKGIDLALRRAEARAEAERKRDTVETAVAAFLENGMKGRKGRPLAAGYIEGTRAISRTTCCPAGETATWRPSPAAT